MSMTDDGFPQKPDDEENTSRDDLDLVLENQALLDDLTIRGMVGMGRADDLDPALENAFLKHVLEFEDACQETGFQTVGDLLPEGYPLPPAADLDDSAVIEKMAEIRAILEERGVVIGFGDKVPERVAYQFFIDECIHDEVMGPLGLPGFTCVLDGCSGCCEECFQLPYCDTGREIQSKSEQE